MDFSKFFRILHSGFKSSTLYELPIEFFNYANEHTLISEKMSKNWFNNNNQSYTKQLKDGSKFKPFNDESFMSFLKSRTNLSWKDIQKSFKNECDKNHMIDCNTTDRDLFLRSLMYQFKEIIGYPYEKILASSERGFGIGTSSEQMRLIFNSIIEQNKIMDIINRKPADLGWMDSAKFNVSLREIEESIINKYESDYCNTALYTNIKIFTNTLRIQALSMEATLSRRFDYGDESAVINMENIDESEEKPNQIVLLRLSIDSLSNAAIDDEIDECEEDYDDDNDNNDDDFDTMNLAEIAVSGWGKFRNEMNLLYKKIYENTHK